MKRFWYVLGSCVLVSLATLGSLSGCGGLECAEGTVQRGGECLVEGDFQECAQGEIFKDGECVDPQGLCEGGTVYDSDQGVCMTPYEEIVCGPNTYEEEGQCVAVEPKECGGGEGTVLDVNTNRCVATDVNCGENTEFTEVDGVHVCLSTEEVCDDGTEFAEEVGLCFPDFDCQPGDVVIDGYCVPQVMELLDDADYVATGNTNPHYGGTPVSMNVGDVGESAIFGGVIGEPEDFNGDGQLDQVVDVFEFEAQQGDWFEIAVRSAGLPSPAFVVSAVGYEDTGNGLTPDVVGSDRMSAVGTGQDKVRQIVIPADGAYQVAVLPEALLMNSEFLLGDEDWSYVGTVERLATPQADVHDFSEENLEGTIGRLDQNYYAVEDFEAGNQVRFVWEKEPKNADAVATVWTWPEEIINEYDEDNFVVDVPASGTFFIIIDWRSRKGDVGLDFELSAEELVVVHGGDEVMESFSTEEGDVVEISQSNYGGEPMMVTVTDDDTGAEIVSDLVGDGDWLQYYPLDAGDYTVSFANEGEDSIIDLETAINVLSPFEATVFSADAEDVVEISQDNPGDLSVDVFITDEQGDVVAEALLPAGEDFSFEVEESGDHRIWYFRSGEPADEQEVDDIEFTVD